MGLGDAVATCMPILHQILHDSITGSYAVVTWLVWSFTLSCKHFRCAGATCASTDPAILLAELPHTEVSAARAGPKDAAVRGTPVVVPNQAPEPVSPARKRGRPKGSKNGSSTRSRLIAGKARAMAHAAQAQAASTPPQALPAVAQAPAAPQQGPAAQVLEQAPDAGRPKRKRGRPKGSRSVSKPSIALPAQTAVADPTATRPAAAPAAVAGEASAVTQPPRKRGRPKGSKNAPLGERLPIA